MTDHYLIDLFFLLFFLPFHSRECVIPAVANTLEIATAVRLFFASLHSKLAVNIVAKLRLLLFFDLSTRVMPCKCA